MPRETPEEMAARQAEFDALEAAAVRAAGDAYDGPADAITMIAMRDGYGVRSSAPGCMDATDWRVHATRDEAEEDYWAEREELDEGDPQVVARYAATEPIVTTDIGGRPAWGRGAATSAYHHFRGRGYAAREAVRLARGERFVRELSAFDPPRAAVAWDADPDYDPSDYDVPGMPDAGYVCTVSVHGADGSISAWRAVGCVTFGRDTTDPTADPYARDVAADLAAELLAEFSAAIQPR